MIIIYALPISFWPTLGKENRYFYTRHPNNNDRWIHDIIFVEQKCRVIGLLTIVELHPLSSNWIRVRRGRVLFLFYPPRE